MNQRSKVQSGFPGLDGVIDFLRIGDNVVLQVDHITDYESFVLPFVKISLETGRKVIYMRFARHYPIIEDTGNITVYNIDAEHGFESFSTQVHDIITMEGQEAFYVFDCLSELLYTWATDLMIGNFFQITCPYLYELNTVAYFAIYKNMNSYETISAIRETTQVMLNIYKVKGSTYVHPIKVVDRYTPTMFLPHMKEGQKFIPLTSSSDASKLFSDMSLKVFDGSRRTMDYWDRLFMKASEAYEKAKFGKLPASEEKALTERLCKTLLSRDERLLKLLTGTFSLEDLLQIRSSLIGSGFIGGKAVGMLLARKILLQDSETDYKSILEPHDSFYVGSDVFYTYLVKNGLWKLRMNQRKSDQYFSLAQELRSKILSGVFPEQTRNHFLRVLEYFGQSPIIIRSSSLLEDGFGNSFAGKYESVFCTNQGTLEHRYLEFEKAVKQVFASTMNEDALTYRLKRGLADQDEQMALLIQRVSGSYRQQYFFPDLAGVGYSQNIYVWDKKMSQESGMLRVVVGLGTRAVNRTSGDYARIIALDEPLCTPFAGFDEYKQFSQRKVDVLKITDNNMRSLPFNDLIHESPDPKLAYFALRDHQAEAKMKERKAEPSITWVIHFDEFLANSSLTGVMHKMLKTLEKSYEYPVDIEFTVNFKDENHYQINLLQCRPMQSKGLKSKVEFPRHIDYSRILFNTHSTFMGGNINYSMKRILYVEPKAYSLLSDSEKYRVARCIGKLNNQLAKQKRSALLLGPGRWGTSTPSLGVPVKFSEINNISVLGEIAYIEAGFRPEISYGTHFFQDLIESEIFYVALFPEGKGSAFNPELFGSYANLFPELLPLEASLSQVIRVYDIEQGPYESLEILSDIERQRAVGYFK